MTAALAYLLRALGGISLAGGLWLARRQAMTGVPSVDIERVVAALVVVGCVLLAISFGVSP